MKKQNMTLGEVAQRLNIKKAIIQEWEAAFDISAKQNSYTADDLALFAQIKELIRGRGLSVEEVKSKFPYASRVVAVPATKYVEEESSKTSQDANEKKQAVKSNDEKALNDASKEDFLKQVHTVKKQLLRFKELLK